jgi:hypothetical protein
MSLPETVRVKLSSEAAEAISITPVVVREMPLRELVEYMLGVTGKDVARVHELLLRGTLVSGASRFRWSGWDADAEAIEGLLRTYPDPEPSRLFSATRCTRVVLTGGRQAIEIERTAASRKPLFRRGNFWELLMRLAEVASPRYMDYSYKERADIYVVQFKLQQAAQLREAAGLLKYTALRDQVQSVAFEAATLVAGR